MIFIVLIIFAISIYKIRFAKGSSYHLDYMSIEKTVAIKGIFILFVFLRHFAQYVSFNNYYDSLFLRLDSLLGQLIVVMFLFYSGYGILESIKKKNMEYINNMPKDRIFKLLFDFDIAIVLFLIIDLLLGRRYNIKTIVLSFIGWDTVGNSNWFIFAILLSYLFTYFSFKLFKNKHKMAVSSITILSILYVIIMQHFKEAWWYNTFLCYSAGMWFSLYKKPIENVIQKNNLTYLLSLSIFLILFRYTFFNIWTNVMFYEIWSLLFIMIIILITMKVSFNNAILNWLGSNLFSLFILQRLPMIVFEYFGLSTYNVYLYFIVCVISTVVSAHFFSNATKRLYTAIFK